MKYILVEDKDIQSLNTLAKVLAEGKYEMKGDSVLAVGACFRHLAALVDRMRNAQVFPEPTPPAPSVQSTAPKKGRK